ncbi:MAG: hypothetical protein OEZ41_02610 [Nitrospirota bacterium]|nr:hypothetical protein [Nitrospirota bacterium]
MRENLQDIGMSTLMGAMLNFVGNDPIAYVRGLPSKTEGFEGPELGIGKTFACIRVDAS